jgi:hypothetical protein
MENRGSFIGVKAGESYWVRLRSPNKTLEPILEKSA